MEVGELHDKVVYETNKPFIRIEGFGKDSNREGYVYKTSKTDRKKFKRQVLEEHNTLKHFIRRFDIDDELARYILPVYERLKRDPTKICNLMENIKLPFNFMWIEFKIGYTNIEKPDASQEPKVLAVAVTKPAEEPNNIFFHFYSEDGYFPIGYKIHGEGEETPLQNMMDDPSLSTEEREANHSEHSRLISRYIYGMPPPNQLDDNEQWGELETDFWESFAHEQFRYQKLLDRTTMFNIDYYVGAVNPVTEQLMNVGYLGMVLRFALIAIETLNYPWVQKEQKMRVVGKKSKTPRIVPHDHYYKAKIVLPKDEVVEIERNTPREDFYGMRQHQVRGHWRVLKNEFGEVRKRIWIDSFVRGNPKLGIVHKDYVLEGDKQKIKEEIKC